MKCNYDVLGAIYCYLHIWVYIGVKSPFKPNSYTFRKFLHICQSYNKTSVSAALTTMLFGAIECTVSNAICVKFLVVYNITTHHYKHTITTYFCHFPLFKRYRRLITAWKVSLVGVILVRIFSHLDWIRRDTPYLSVFSLNWGKCRPE